LKCFPLETIFCDSTCHWFSFLDCEVIMGLSRVGLLKQGHSDIRASSILQIFNKHSLYPIRPEICVWLLDGLKVRL